MRAHGSRTVRHSIARTFVLTMPLYDPLHCGVAMPSVSLPLVCPAELASDRLIGPEPCGPMPTLMRKPLAPVSPAGSCASAHCSELDVIFKLGEAISWRSLVNAFLGYQAPPRTAPLLWAGVAGVCWRDSPHLRPCQGRPTRSPPCILLLWAALERFACRSPPPPLLSFRSSLFPCPPLFCIPPLSLWQSCASPTACLKGVLMVRQ